MKTNIEDITSAIAWYITATQNLAKCLTECDSSPSYYCQRQYMEQNSAKDKLEEALRNYIDEKVEEALKMRKL